MDILPGEQLSHLTLSERVQEILREKIINGEIASGTKLAEESLARELGVSRTPVREALNALRKTGLVMYIPLKGMYVTQLRKVDVDEIYDIRMILEGLAVYRATLRVSEEHLAELRKDLQFSEQQFEKGDLKAFVEADTRFHDRIIANCGNQRLRDQLDRIHDLMVMYRSWGVTQRPLVHSSLKEHREVLEAMIRRDRERAEKRMRQHIESTRIWLLENYPFDAESSDRSYTWDLRGSERVEQ